MNIIEDREPTLAELELALALAEKRYGKWAVITCEIRSQVDKKRQETTPNDQPTLFDV